MIERIILLTVVSVIMTCVSYAQERVSVEDVMNNPKDWDGRTLSVYGQIKKVEQGGKKDSFVIVLKGGLRAEVKRSDVEKMYANGAYAGVYGKKMQVYKLQILKTGKAQIFHTVKVRYSDGYMTNTNRAQESVPIFQDGKGIGIVGTVHVVSDTRVQLDNSEIHGYDYPDL